MQKKICVVMVVLWVVALGTLFAATISGEVTSKNEVISSVNESLTNNDLDKNVERQINFMFICDSASLISNVQYFSGNGFGCQFRVVGIVPSKLYGNKNAFAIGNLPECSPVIFSNEKTNITITYLGDEVIDKNNRQIPELFSKILQFVQTPDQDCHSMTLTEMGNSIDEEKTADRCQLACQTESPAVNESQISAQNKVGECPDNYDPDLVKRNYSRYMDRGFTIGYILVDGGNPDYDWSVEKREYVIAKSIAGINHLAWLCEQKAFPVTFYLNFEYVEIVKEPIKGKKLGAWRDSVHSALDANIGIEGTYDLIWRYNAMFGTPQGCLMYKVNDGDHEWFTNSPPNWAAKWDTCSIIGGGYCITGLSGGLDSDSAHQMWIDNHEILHTIGACDEYPGTTCSIEHCDAKFGIYGRTNMNCPECHTIVQRCLMDSAVAEYYYMCEHTAWHVGLVDTNNDDGPDPVQLCTATALIADDRLHIGDIVELWTLEYSYVSATPVSFWNSYVQNSGRRVVIIPNINQWRNIIATTTYMYRIRHINGETDELTSLPGSAWQTPDHVQGHIGNVEIVDSTLRFQMYHIANLNVWIENAYGNTVARPIFGQLFAGEGDWREVNIGFLLADGQYTVRFRGYGIDGTEPIQRNAGVTIANGVPNAPTLSLDSLDQENYIAWFETKDNGVITQYMKLENHELQIDSFPPEPDYQEELTGSSEYEVVLVAGNINGETPSVDTLTFTSYPRPVTNFTAKPVYIHKTWGDQSGEMVKINSVDLTWDFPQNQIMNKLIEYTIIHNKKDTLHIPYYLTQYRMANLKGYRTHSFDISALDVYGNKSKTLNSSAVVGTVPPTTDVIENNSTALKPCVIEKSVTTFPNPFNATTQVSYMLMAPSHVLVEIYNIMGQKVELLCDDIQPAGENRITWNAEQYGSGIYFYHISTEENTVSGKIILLK